MPKPTGELRCASHRTRSISFGCGREAGISRCRLTNSRGLAPPALQYTVVMSSDQRSFDRRDFLRQAGALSATLSTALAKSSNRSSGRVIGANDRINLGIVGCGDRGYGMSTVWAKIGAEKGTCRVVAVADCYQRRVNK